MEATTPLWVPLVVAVLGLLGTAGGAIAGVLITQRRSDRREKAAWERERVREREVWAREDAARTFDLRRESYETLLKATDDVIRDYVKVLKEQLDPSLGRESVGGCEFSWEKAAALDAALERVMIFGSTAVAALASSFRRSVLDGRTNLSPQSLAEIDVRKSGLVNAIRIELGIPEGPIERVEAFAEMLGDISMKYIRRRDT